MRHVLKITTVISNYVSELLQITTETQTSSELLSVKTCSRTRLRTRPHYREYHNREKKQQLDNRNFIQERMTIVLKDYPVSREKKKHSAK